MTIAATLFVNVSVQIAAASIDRFSFGTALFACEQDVDLDRYSGPYASITEVEDAGFTEIAAVNVHRAATAFFGVSNSGDSFAVGRKIGSGGSDALAVLVYDDSEETYADVTAAYNAGANWSPLPVTEGVGDRTYYIMPSPFSGASFTVDTQGVGGTIVWEYWDGNDWELIAGITDGTVGYTAAATTTISFTPPINWTEGEVNGVAGFAIRSRVTGVYATNPIYDAAFIAGDASWTEAMSAIVASAGSEAFYWHTADTKVKADIEALTLWSNAQPLKRYVSQSSDLALLMGSANNVGENLNDAGYKKNVLLYRAVSTGDAGYCDNAAMGKLAGFDLEAPQGNQPLIYQSLEGQAADAITTAQATYLHSVGCNVYATSFGLTFVSQGTSSAGAPWFTQIQTTLDYCQRRVTEDLLAYLVANKPPLNNFGIQGGAAVIQSRLEQMVDNGMLSGDFPRIVRAPDITEIDPSDRKPGIVRYSVAATVLNSIVKIYVNVNFSF